MPPFNEKNGRDEKRRKLGCQGAMSMYYPGLQTCKYESETPTADTGELMLA